MRQFLLGQGIDVAEDVELLIRSQDQVHAVDVRDLLRTKLRKTSGDDDEGIRIGPQRFSNGLPAFAVRFFRDRARVQHDDVGCRSKRDDIVGLIAELPGHGAGFSEIELAAQGMEGDGCHAKRGEFERWSAAVQRGWYFRGFTHHRAAARLH